MSDNEDDLFDFQFKNFQDKNNGAYNHETYQKNDSLEKTDYQF